MDELERRLLRRKPPVGLGAGNPQADRLSTRCRVCDGEGVLFHPFPQALDGVEIDRVCPACYPPEVPS